MPKEPSDNLPNESVPGADFKPAEHLVISNVEQLKAISDPLRLNILELIIREALTVKQMAGRLNQPPTKLYYHVAELEKAGFVVMVDTRVKSGIIEKYYRTAAEIITIDHNLLNAGDQDSTVSDLLTMIFSSTAQEILQSITAGLVDVKDLTDNKSSGMILLRSFFTFKKEKLPEFIQKFMALLAELDAEGDQPGPDSVDYGCMIAFYPRVSPDHADQD